MSLPENFLKRYSKVQFRAVDDLSYNEMLEQKRAMIEENLLADASAKLTAKMLEMGMDPQLQRKHNNNYLQKV